MLVGRDIVVSIRRDVVVLVGRDMVEAANRWRDAVVDGNDVYGDDVCGDDVCGDDVYGDDVCGDDGCDMVEVGNAPRDPIYSLCWSKECPVLLV